MPGPGAWASSSSEYLGELAATGLDEPHIADLMAAGVMYYRMLVDRHPYYEGSFTEPAWLGGMTQDTHVTGFDEALKRLEGTLVGPDHEKTCALITYSELGNEKRPDTLDVLDEMLGVRTMETGLGIGQLFGCIQPMK